MMWLELFAGAGGASLGIRAAGGQCLAAVELDSDACATLAAAGFNARHEDLRHWSPSLASRPDALWSSFPCQGWSTAGKRLGARDERNGWPWTLRIVDEVCPQWIVLENVVGLTLHSGDCGNPDLCPGCYFKMAILDALNQRYPIVQWVIMDAADYGVPQHRKRVFVVAGPKPIRWPVATHGPPGVLDFFSPLLPWVSCGEALGLDGGAGNAGPFVARKSQNPAVLIADRAVENINAQPAPTISARYGSACTYGPHGGSTLGGVPFVEGHNRRRLTVAECARLQGFPDGHPFTGSDNSKYRQVGNAVPPIMSYVIARSIQDESR